jgi:glycine/D-amino acid oxidase-like deaminating enzyme
MDAEILIVGAGIFGLSIARALKAAGRDVLVVDAVGPGAGASATPLGVLAPHSPDRWNEKKQAQFEALTSLAAVAEDLQQETGFDVGYRQCGRLIPLTRENQVALWRARSADAEVNWQGRAGLSIVEPDPSWLAHDAAPFGSVLCGLSARIDARAYCRALAASIGSVTSGLRLQSLEVGSATFDTGETLRANRIILATGADAFRFLPDIDDDTPSGRGEKGQAALLRLSPGDDTDELPLIYSDRLYIVPQGNGIVAVGATSEREYESDTDTDKQLDDLIQRARDVSPRLFGAEVIERWARLRPRAADKRLLVENHPTLSRVFVATGGFKTGLAMAHVVAARVAEQV